MIPHVLRDSVPSDAGFILHTWKKQCLDTAPLAFIRSKALVFGIVNQAIDPASSRSLCRIACAPDDAGLILGFIVAEPDAGAVHCVYVKTAYRRFGLARLLLAEAPGCRVATMWTPIAEKIGAAHGYRYEPSKLWGTPPPIEKRWDMR